MNLASLCFCLGKCVLHNGFTFFSSPLFADMMSAFNEFACQAIYHVALRLIISL